MIKYFKDIFSGAWSLLVGMRVTGGYGLKRTITVHYPFEEIDITPNFRGHIDLVVKKSGWHKCISCGMCDRTCPSGCITIEAVKPEGAKKKELVAYHLDFTKCSLCGNCVEICPTKALDFSNEYNLVGTSRHDFHFELVGRAKAKAEAMGLTWGPPAPKPKPEPEASDKPEGSTEPSPAAT